MVIRRSTVALSFFRETSIIFGVPILAVLAMWLAANPPASVLEASFVALFVINVAFVGIPQLIWWAICFLKVPRAAYWGGLIGCDAFLLYAVWWYRFRVVGNDPYNEGASFVIGLMYLPFSPVSIIVGAVLGYVIGKLMPAFHRS